MEENLIDKTFKRFGVTKAAEDIIFDITRAELLADIDDNVQEQHFRSRQLEVYKKKYGFSDWDGAVAFITAERARLLASSIHNKDYYQWVYHNMLDRKELIPTKSIKWQQLGTPEAVQADKEAADKAWREDEYKAWFGSDEEAKKPWREDIDIPDGNLNYRNERFEKYEKDKAEGKVHDGSFYATLYLTEECKKAYEVIKSQIEKEIAKGHKELEDKTILPKEHEEVGSFPEGLTEAIRKVRPAELKPSEIYTSKAKADWLMGIDSYEEGSKGNSIAPLSGGIFGVVRKNGMIPFKDNPIEKDFENFMNKLQIITKNKKTMKIKNQDLAFGYALEAVKNGQLAAREGWNGKGMFIFMQPTDELDEDMVIEKVKSLPDSVKNYFANEKKKRTEQEVKGAMSSAAQSKIKFTAYLCMKAADGSIVNGWLASQTDIVSEDWCIVEPE